MQKNNHQLHIDFERGNILVWIACIAALLWLLLKASGVLAADVNLSWDVAAGADTYTVYQSTDNGATWTAAASGVMTTSTTIAGVPDSGLVLFRVSAVNSVAEAIKLNSGAWYNGDWLPPVDPGGLGIQ